MNAGLLAPGFSPEIVTINGDYTQQPTGTLEIEVGGLTPGTEHDMLIVTGIATLNGRLNLPIINNFHPQLGNEIQYLLAPTIEGEFDEVVSNLGSVDNQLAFHFARNSAGKLTGRVQFVNKVPNAFVSQNQACNFSDPACYLLNAAPDSATAVDAQPQAMSDQTIVVGENPSFPRSAHPVANDLTVRGFNPTMTVVIQAGSSLSLIAGATIEQKGIIQLDGGKIVTNRVRVMPDGAFVGAGRLEGDLINGEGLLGPGGGVAIVSPGVGSSIGHVEVDGNYQQVATGMLTIDVHGTSGAAQIDTVDVTGAAELGGTLRINAAGFTLTTPGELFGIIDAGSGAGEFDRVETVGNNLIYLRRSILRREPEESWPAAAETLFAP